MQQGKALLLNQISLNHANHAKLIQSPQLIQYFHEKTYINQSSKKQFIGKALLFIENINKKINDEIRMGYQQLEQQSHDIKNFLIQQKISKQQQKTFELKLKRDQLEMRLHYLDAQIHNKSVDNIQLTHHNVLTKDEHTTIINKMAHEREKAAKKRKLYQEYLEKKRLSELSQQKILQKQELEKQKQQRRKKIELKFKENKQKHQKDIKQYVQRQKQYEQVKQRKKLYQQIQERYNSHVVIPSLQNKKKKLKEMRQFRQAFDISSIKNHQHQYLKKRDNSLRVTPKLEQNWNYKPPQRSERIKKILQQQKIQLQKKIQEKKKQLEDRIIRQQEFVARLKSKTPPKIDPKLRQQIETRNKKPQKKKEVNAKQQGVSYLEELKRNTIKKKATFQHSKQKNKSLSDQQYALKQQKTQKRYTNYLNHTINNSDYQEIRRKKIQLLVNSQENDPISKIKKLHMEAEQKARQSQRKQQLLKFSNNQSTQQQAVDLLLTSIKAKIGIMDVYKKIQ